MSLTVPVSGRKVNERRNSTPFLVGEGKGLGRANMFPGWEKKRAQGNNVIPGIPSGKAFSTILRERERAHKQMCSHSLRFPDNFPGSRCVSAWCACVCVCVCRESRTWNSLLAQVCLAFLLWNTLFFLWIFTHSFLLSALIGVVGKAESQQTKQARDGTTETLKHSRPFSEQQCFRCSENGVY